MSNNSIRLTCVQLFMFMLDIRLGESKFNENIKLLCFPSYVIALFITLCQVPKRLCYCISRQAKGLWLIEIQVHNPIVAVETFALW